MHMYALYLKRFVEEARYPRNPDKVTIVFKHNYVDIIMGHESDPRIASFYLDATRVR